MVAEPDQPANLFSTHFLRQCRLQADLLQADIVLAVKSRNSLHGCLTTLMLLLTDPCSPEFCALQSPDVDRLLRLLNETCAYILDILCVKSRSTNFAPSFGEMGEAMDCLIHAEDDSDTLTLTPAHQTLFNCIWMNLKTCCTLASELTVAYSDRLERSQVVFASEIVSHVLHKCRHKGAIQNTGLALNSIVSKCLYEDAYPLELLEYTLQSVLECTPGGTVSRKSAGVAILVHKLLASQHSLKEKLFVTALDKLIRVASSPVETSEETLKIDLPQTIAFHMLQFIVADAGLRAQTIGYLERITSLCLDKMQCPEWTVRNAALQVFGVLLPKLVGTKKQDSANQSSNVAFEEFFYQLPRIGDCLRHVLSPLRERSTSGTTLVNTVNTSVLVSTLTLLSRLKITGDLGSGNQERATQHRESSDLNQEHATQHRESSDLSQEHATQHRESSDLNQEHATQHRESASLNQESTASLNQESASLNQESTSLNQESTSLNQESSSLNQERAQLKQFLGEVYRTLLASNIHTVRFLAADCYVNSLHRHAQLLEQFDSILFSCLEYIFNQELTNCLELIPMPKTRSFLSNSARARIVNENHLHGSLLMLDILKERIHLENLKLDEDFLGEVLFVLNSNPCGMILNENINLSTCSMMYKIFRPENERLQYPQTVCKLKRDGHDNCLTNFSAVVRDLIKQTRVGWKLWFQEVAKFQMFKQLFPEDGSIDFSYIKLLVDSLEDFDILKDVLSYLSQLLEEYSVRNFDSIQQISDREGIAKSSSNGAPWVEAYKCMKHILSVIALKETQMTKVCAEQLFNVVIQMYNMFAEDDHIQTVASYDYDLLYLGNSLLNVHCKSDSVEYTCPAVLPVLALCISLPLPEGVQQSELQLSDSNDFRERFKLFAQIRNQVNTFILDERCNEEYRYNAAVAMSILYGRSEFRSLYSRDMIANAIHLLQDEVYAVRQEITCFVRKLEKSSPDRTEKSLLVKNPYVYLFSFLSSKCSYGVDLHVYLDVFLHLLFIDEQDMDRAGRDEAFSNPFDHNLRNFYSEPVRVAQFVSGRLSELLDSTRSDLLDKTRLSELLGKCTVHLEANAGNVRLNEQGRMKLKLLNETKSKLEKVVHDFHPTAP